MITLEDENSREFEVKYFPTWIGFSNGWKKLVDANNLHQGDAMLFHLTDPTKFKIYIIRLDDCQVDVKASPQQQNEQGGSEPSKDTADHQSIDLGTIEEFQLKIHGLPSDFMKKYYELCHSKKVILHKNILHLNNDLVTGIVSEIVNIVDEVKSSSIFTPRENLERWENSLESFILLGMDVEFLVDRVRQLLKLQDDFDRSRFGDKIKSLETEHIKLKEECEKVGANIMKLKSEVETREVGFQEVVYSPW